MNSPVPPFLRRCMLPRALCMALVLLGALHGGVAREGRLALPEVGSEVAASVRGTADEYSVKAAFLYNFTLYTTWPAGSFKNPKSPIELLVVGSDPFLGGLSKTFEGKLVHGRKVVVRWARSVPSQIRAHLIFVTDLDQRQSAKLLALCKHKAVLLMGDRKGFAERGGCADFYVSKGKVRFRVNTGEAKRRRLEISSQLLKLATIVKPKPKSLQTDSTRR